MKKNNEPKIRILRYLYKNQEKKLTQSQLAKELDLHYSTISTHIHNLQKDGWLIIQKGVYTNKITPTRKLCNDVDHNYVDMYS